MRAKREWKHERSSHARFLEGLEAAVASHPSVRGRGGANADDGSREVRPRLTVVGSERDNVIPLARRRVRGPRPAPRPGGSPAD
jgi:hypothetical protein